LSSILVATSACSPSLLGALPICRGAYTEVLAGFGDVLGDLLAQFAGRYDHQYLWGSVTGKLQPVQQRHAEAVCLPHAGPCLPDRSEEHTSELQSRFELVCRRLLE